MTKTRPFYSTAFLSLLGRSGGFIIPFVIAKIYGANESTDAFFFAYGVTVLWMTIFTHIFESSLIPFLAEQKKDPRAVSVLVNRTLLFAVSGAVFVGTLTAFFLPSALVRWGGWSQLAGELTGNCLWQMLFFLVLGVFIAACHSLLFTYKQFWMPALSPIFRSLTVIAGVLILHHVFEIRALTYGFVAGELIRLIATWICLRKKTPWTPDLGSDYLKCQPKTLRSQIALQALALAAVNALFLSDQWFAGQLGNGSLSLLNYADRVLQIPYILLMSSFLQIFLTDWSDTFHAEPSYEFWPKIQKDIQSVFWICAALGVGFWLLRHPIISLVYHYGQFTAEELETIGNLFGWLSLGFIPGVVRLLCGRVLFVMKKSVLYCAQSWLELAANILLNMVLMRSIGIVGIAMATAIVYSISTLVMVVYVRGHAKKGMKL